MGPLWWARTPPRRKAADVVLWRPLCGVCLGRPVPTVEPEPCQVCEASTGYADPPPPGTGLWRPHHHVCGFECLAVARAEWAARPVAPRACEHCGEPFTPKRHRSTARTCSARCRKARSRDRPLEQLREQLAEVDGALWREVAERVDGLD